MTNNTAYIVKEVIEEASDVKTLKLTLEDGSVPSYTAGQFITVYFPETKTAEGKAYTFSSAPHEKTCDITVKNIGEFSGKLCALKVGDTLTASLPYGFFSSDAPESELIAIAGGIGVTPFRSMITDMLRTFPTRPIHLFYSTKTMSDIVFKKELDELSKKHPHIKITYHLTQEQHVPEEMVKGRIDVVTLLHTLEKTTDKEFLICGSISFVRDIWKALRDQGISEDALYTEAFFK